MTWQPIDSAPKGEPILIYSPKLGVLVSWWSCGYTGIDGRMEGWRDEPSDGVDRVLHDYPDFLAKYDIDPEEPTHWMPLPEPPRLPVDEEGV